MTAATALAVHPHWLEVRDGNPDARSLFGRHYTYNMRREQISLWMPKNRTYSLFVGPGEKLVLLSSDKRSLFVWRKFHSQDGQQGVNCSVFRNESANRASELIRAADDMAFARWPGERHFTYVDERRIRRTRQPGRCFLKAGWVYVRSPDGSLVRTKKRKLLILEITPALARCDREQQEILEHAASGELPAWLVTLGYEDWEMEKRLILKEAGAQPGRTCSA